MNAPSLPQDGQVLGAATQRACDECRTRKTRCDRASPCSHCRASGLACRTTTQRTKEHKDRIHVTKQYEEKIDRINNRLAHIERLLEEPRGFVLPSPASNSSLQARSSVSSKPWESASSLSHLDHESSASTPAGDVGPRAESIAAKNLFEQTVSRDTDPAVRQDPQLRAALQALRKIINHAQIDATDLPRTLPPATASTWMARPPGWEQVEPLLKRLAGAKSAKFTWLSPALLDHFCRKSRSMYQQGAPSSPTDKLLVYSIMANICSEFSGADEGEAADYNHSLSRSFSNMLLESLASFPILTPPCMDAVEALMVAASTTVSLCKPSLTWSLTSTAARMCQALGYNRLSRVDPESDPLFHRKVVLFWSIYVLDRSNSLRLGRAPAINDYDIDTPMPTVSDRNPPTTVAMLEFWIECARVQGKVCIQLYGPSASFLAPNERIRLAEALSDELEQIHQRKLEANTDLAPKRARQATSAADELMMYGESVRHYSALTMALYAIPSNHQPYSRALETARKCLRLNRELSESHRESNVYVWTVYCHWVLLDISLTPFTAIFCNTVANPESSQADLELLEDFVASLRPAAQLSEGVGRFHQLCSIFVKVAQAYVQAKARQQSAGGNKHNTNSGVSPSALAPAIVEFDEHLAALGCFGPQYVTRDTGNNALSGDESSGNTLDQQKQPLATPSLLDWYSGHMSLYGLLEQDLNEIAYDYLGEIPADNSDCR